MRSSTVQVPGWPATNLNAGLDRVFGSISQEIGKSLAAVHRFEWNAPWIAKVATPTKDAA
jgi:hypothetical protein